MDIIFNVVYQILLALMDTFRQQNCYQSVFAFYGSLFGEVLAIFSFLAFQILTQVVEFIFCLIFE